MGSCLCNLQLGFGLVEEVGQVLVLLHFFFEPADGAGDGDRGQLGRENARLPEFQSGISEPRFQYQAPSSIPLKWRMGRHDPNAFGNFIYGPVGAALDIPLSVLQPAAGLLSTVNQANNPSVGLGTNLQITDIHLRSPRLSPTGTPTTRRGPTRNGES